MPPIGRRRGVSYVYFLSVMMLLSVIGLSAIMSARIERRAVQSGDDALIARYYAQSALELAYTKINLDPNWRTNLGSGAWYTNQSIGDGELSLSATIFVNADGDGISENDPVLLVGTGVYGRATHKIEVTLSTLSDKGGLVVAEGSARRNTG